ncbi:hypothetical protein ACD661_07795 [Legionella lytica]|uniref:O-Antigen ligase n=1 Tax=Legionella lytica TaxID=96232 RepID=A0ABW8D9C7_9GAMM
MEIKILSLKFGIASVLFLFLFSLLGLNLYQGASFYYFIFDVSWLAVLFCAFCFSQSYVIFYTQLMLFLGFWAKFMAHLIFGVFFIEPTGYWTHKFETPAAWDHVLLISSLAACGILAANLLFYLCTKKKSHKNINTDVPQWYNKHSDFIWYALLFVGITTNTLNIFYHISTAGLRPQVILPFHLNAILIWLMVIAIPLSMAIFLGWEQNPRQGKQRFYCICFMAFFTSLSILSRATYLFWTLPYILLLFSKFNFSFKKLALWENRNIIITYLTLFALSIVLVNIIRINHYSTLTIEERSSGYALTGGPISAGKGSSIHGEKFSQLAKLFVGRWVGLEAVMATTAYPQSSWVFFKESIIKKPSVGDIGIFTQTVLKPNKYHNNHKTMFSSLPGLIAILNYANSPALIFWGMLSICFLLCCLERMVFFIIRNKFLLSQQGLILGYWCVSGLNIPYLGFINLLECIFVSLSICLIGPLYDWITKFSLKKSSPYSI